MLHRDRCVRIVPGSACAGFARVPRSAAAAELGGATVRCLLLPTLAGSGRGHCTLSSPAPGDTVVIDASRVRDPILVLGNWVGVAIAALAGDEICRPVCEARLKRAS